MKKTLNIRLKNLPNEHYHIDDIYNNIGIVYRCLNYYDIALDYFNKSLKIYEKILFAKHPSIASIYKK